MCVCVCVCVRVSRVQKNPNQAGCIHYEPPAGTEVWAGSIQTYSPIPLSGLENRPVVIIHLVTASLKEYLGEKNLSLSSFSHYCVFLTFFFSIIPKGHIWQNVLMHHAWLDT